MSVRDRIVADLATFHDRTRVESAVEHREDLTPRVLRANTKTEHESDRQRAFGSIG